MKRLIALLFIATISSFTMSCNDDDSNGNYVDNDTYSEVYDINNVNFGYDNNTGYFIKRSFSKPLYNTDMVLIYQNTAVDNGNKVWTLIPRTIYLNDGNEVDYTFDFTASDVQIYAGATFNLANTEYVTNKSFRVLVIPAALARSQSTVDFSDYNAVVKFYNLNDKKVYKL